jgi:hypothetical protein
MGEPTPERTPDTSARDVVSDSPRAPGALGSSARVRLGNEFALVDVTVDRRANGPRLEITSIRTGHSRYLDPFMLEILTWLPLDHLVAALETPFGPEADLQVRPAMCKPHEKRDDDGAT